MQRLSSNAEIREFLFDLQSLLTTGGASPSLIEALTVALGQGMITEFLGESRIALRRVRSEAPALLSPTALEAVEAVLQQLDEVFERR